MPSLDELNERQREAAMHVNGPCVVIAAAGSGKTAMLIARIKYLIDNRIAPQRILACTFTKKAAKEMETRLVELVGVRGKQVTMGTIHSIAYRMLMDTLHIGKGEEWELVTDPTWLVELALEAPSQYNPHGVGSLMTVDEAVQGITKAKADALTTQQVENPRLRKVYEAYERLKTDKKRLDFEDLLLTATRLLRADSEFAAKWQNRWDYLLVDEFQDTNTTQWLFLLELAKEKENIFVVGDDWQSVYGFRGAKPQLLSEFVKRFPQARRVFLTMNYRSNDLIVDLGNRVIELNRGYQINKTVEASREISNHTIAQIVNVKTDVEEAKFVAQEIARLHEHDAEVAWKEYAVLYRTNIQSRMYEEALAEHDIPYHVVGDSHFYENRDVKAILDYLRTTQDQSNPSVWRYLLNRPNRFIPRDVVNEAVAGGWGILVRLPRCSGFVRTIHELKRHDKPAEAIQWLIATEKKFLREQDEDEPIQWADSLIQAASRFETVPSFLQFVDRMIEQSKKPKGDAVQLSTIHRSKGLEYQTVFVVGMVEGLLPHKESLVGEPLREETRLCYVALTRAKENLYLLSANRYGNKELELSRFVRVLQQ